MKICWIKLGGWPDAYDERAEVMASHVDELVLVRPKNKEATGDLKKVENITEVNLYPEREPIHDSSHHKLRYPFWVLQAIILYLIWSLKNGKCDIVHSLDPKMSALPSIPLSVITRVPFVVSVRGLHMANTNSDSTISGRLLATVLHYIRALTFKFADHVIVKSVHQTEFIVREYGFARERISVIPTGVDFDRLDPARVKDHTILNEIAPSISEADRIVLYLGRLSRSKGIVQLLKHIHEVKFEEDVRFLFVGEFQSKELQRETKQIIESNELESKVVIYEGWISFERVPNLLDSVDALCLLSESGVEGVPRVLQEACAMETPIVAADVPGISGAFQGYEGCILIDRGDTMQFHDAIRKIIQSSPDRKQFQGNFDIGRNYGRYSEIYASLRE